MDRSNEFENFPKRVVVELTNICNLDCSYCPRHDLTMSKGYMNPNLFKHIINQCHEHSCDVIPFWRGEMFLHPNVIELLTYATYSVPNVYIATGGNVSTLNNIPQATFDRLASISVSLHNSTSIGMLWNLNTQRELALPHLQASSVRGTRSEDIMDTFSFDYLPPTDTLRKYEQHSKDGKWGQTNGHIDEPKREFLCERLITDLVISWDGSISRCCYVWPTLKSAKNDANTCTLKELWTESALLQVREHYPDRICLVCDQWRGRGKSL